MSNRERWIIYPLLFMTLGITIRGRLFLPKARTPGVKVEQVDALDVHAVEVHCRSLTVTNADGAPRLRIGVTPNGAGRLEIYEGSEEMVVLIGTDQAGQSGLIKVFSSGKIEVLSSDEQVATYVGFREDEPGVFVNVLGSGRNMRLTSSVVDWLELVRNTLEANRPHEPHGDDQDGAEDSNESSSTTP